MAKEIERKFLVEGDFMPFVESSSRIAQGYIARSEELTLRVRTRDDKGYLTIKGRSDEAGMRRDEWEYEIPVEEARELLRFSRGTIDKTRYLVPVGRHTFEVDCFYGENEGLVMAEVELKSEDESFERPAWLGREVTGDRRYYNSQLLKNPYTKWRE
ncbi:MAG: CYTH domain-containing protein [Alistipes sp.]|jgi:CYTH domain-containing protein|nr:CYTH domain-containing protein [Alistipes sp.]